MLAVESDADSLLHRLATTQHVLIPGRLITQVACLARPPKPAGSRLKQRLGERTRTCDRASDSDSTITPYQEYLEISVFLKFAPPDAVEKDSRYIV
jgi:hypothetical protein